MQYINISRLYYLLESVRFGLSRLWSWWIGELYSTVPASVLKKLITEKDHIEISRPDGRLTLYGPSPSDVPLVLAPSNENVSSSVAERMSRADGIVLILRSNEVIRRVVELPAAAAGDLSMAMPYIVERHTPFLANGALYAYRVIGRKNKEIMLVEMAATPKVAVQSTESELATYEIKLNAIWLEDDQGTRALRFDVDGAQRKLKRPWREPSHFIWAATACLLLMGPLVVTQFVREEVISYRERGAAARRAANGLNEIQDKFQSELAIVRFLHGRALAPQALDILASLTDNLPDDSWLFTFDFEGKALRIAGYSKDVPNMLRRLQGLSWVKSVDFQAPVIRGATSAGDRFDIFVYTREPLNDNLANN